MANRAIHKQRREIAKRAEGRLALLFLRTGFVLVAAGNSSVAQVQLPAVNLGDTNFEDGLGAPGWLLEEFPTGYRAGEMKDARGRTIAGGNRLTAYSATTHVAFIGHKHLLGGWVVGEALLPVVDIDVELDTATNRRVRGFGDLTVGSGLQWAPKKIGKGIFAQRVMLDVGVPTGAYSAARPVNPGNHFVVVNPYYAFTYEPHEKVEFSGRVHYLWNSTNHDPYVAMRAKNVQAGQAFHMNYTTSYEFFNDVRFGFNGYWLQQLSDDKITGVSLPNSRERTVGLGPGIQLSSRGLWFRLNSYIEAGVRNRSSGIKVTLRISKTILAESPDP